MDNGEDRVALVEQRLNKERDSPVMPLWSEYQPPLTTKITPAPLASFFGEKRPWSAALPNLRP